MRRTVYVCGTCGLMLEIGWKHVIPTEKWYYTQTRLICKKCGAQYQIEMPAGKKETAYVQFYDVILESCEPKSKHGLMKLLRELKGFELKEAKDIVESLPYTIESGISKQETSHWEKSFKEINVNLKLKKLRKIPIQEPGPSLPDRLLFKDRQVFLEELPEISPESFSKSNYYHAISAIIDKQWRDNDEEWQEIKPVETKNNEILFEKQPCQNCLAVGKISSDIRDGDPCPHCKEKTLLSLYSYLT